MKILIFGHPLDVGGAQVNAIDVASTLRERHGHDVVYFARPGVLVEVLERRGLRFLPAPSVSTHPSLRMMRALRAVVRQEKPDIVHAWDWYTGLDAFYGVHLPYRTPVLLSDMISEHITRFLPKRLPTTFGTPEYADIARRAGWRRVSLLVPPVDTICNAAGAVENASFRQSFGVRDGEILIVTISRLAQTFKSESISRTIEVVGQLGREFPIRFFVVGDGEARQSLERLATQVNQNLGREVIVFCGQMVDPRPAYSAADIVVGMGGSALRGMAFEKPVIVVGAGGFSDVFTPASAPHFFYCGMYGKETPPSNNEKHSLDLRILIADAALREQLGQFSRQFIVENFSLEAVTAHLDRTLVSVVAERPTPLLTLLLDGVRTEAIRNLGRFVPAAAKRPLS